MGDRGSGRGPSWSVERRPGTGPSRAETRPRQAPGRRAAATGRRTREGVERRPLLAVEEPGEPQREPADQARLDRRDRPQTVPGLPAQLTGLGRWVKGLVLMCRLFVVGGGGFRGCR